MAGCLDSQGGIIPTLGPVSTSKKVPVFSSLMWTERLKSSPVAAVAITIPNKAHIIEGTQVATVQVFGEDKRYSRLLRLLLGRVRLSFQPQCLQNTKEADVYIHSFVHLTTDQQALLTEMPRCCTLQEYNKTALKANFSKHFYPNILEVSSTFVFTFEAPNYEFDKVICYKYEA
ncbi:unnamed protein product [Trichobilharzia regenti]|nr:unnamed protein product [Trichobilharzia regenti]